MNDTSTSSIKNKIVRNLGKSGTSEQRPAFRSWESARGATASEQGSVRKPPPSRQFSFAHSRDFRAILAFALAATVAAATYFILNAS